MNLVDTTITDILYFFKDKLDSALGGTLSKNVQIVCDHEDLFKIPPKDLIVAIIPNEAIFRVSEQDIGHITEEWSITVSIFTRNYTDRAGTIDNILNDSRRGLFTTMHKVLVALCGKFYTGHNLQGTIAAMSHSEIKKLIKEDSNLSFYYLDIIFSAKFDWAL